MAENNETLLKYLTEENFSKNLLTELNENNSSDKIIDFLINKKIVLAIDWSGEDNEGEILTFVNDKLKNIHNANIKIDGEKIYKTIKNDELEKGDAQIIIFEKIDRQLKKQGYKLIFINNGNDSYIFTVVKKINYKNLLKIENIKFENIPVKDNIKPFIAEIKCNKCGKDHTLFLPWDGNIKCKNCGNLLYDPKDETTLKKCIIIKTY